MNRVISMFLGITPEHAGGVERARQSLEDHRTNHVIFGVTNPQQVEFVHDLAEQAGMNPSDVTILFDRTEQGTIEEAAAEVRGFLSWASTLVLDDETANPENLQAAKRAFNAWGIRVTTGK